MPITGAILDRAVRHGTANVVMCRLRYRLDQFAPHDAGSAPSPDAVPGRRPRPGGSGP